MKIRATLEWKDEENFPGVRAVLRALGAGALLRLQGKIESHVSEIERLTEPFHAPIKAAMDEAEKGLPPNATPEQKEAARTDGANTITIPAAVIRKIEMERSAIDHEYLRAGLVRVEGVDISSEPIGTYAVDSIRSDEEMRKPLTGESIANLLLESGSEAIPLVNALIAAIKAESALSDAERKN